jgi:hypothetical protein
MITCARSGGVAPSGLTSSLDGVVGFTAGESEPWYQLDRKHGGPQSRSDAVEKRKLTPLVGIEPLLFSS